MSCVWDSTKEVVGIMKEFVHDVAQSMDMFDGLKWSDFFYRVYQVIYAIVGMLITLSFLQIPAGLLDYYNVSWWIGIPSMLLMFGFAVVSGIWFIIVWCNCDDKRNERKWAKEWEAEEDEIRKENEAKNENV